MNRYYSEGKMNLRFFQKGFNYSQDGRGNRLVYHLQGCNMRCPWCANPEGISRMGILMTDPDWLDESCCPKGAVSDGKLDRQRCDSCADRPCINGRRQKGIRWSCEESSVEQVAADCVRSRAMFFDGGGVTLYRLNFGEIDGADDMDEDILLQWPDGSRDVIHYHCGNHRYGKNFGCDRSWKLNGEPHDGSLFTFTGKSLPPKDGE